MARSVQPDVAIAGKVVVITGASSGLGEATARHLLRRARSSSSARGEPID